MTAARIERRSDGVVVVSAGSVAVFLAGPSPREVADAVKLVEAQAAEEERERRERAS
jgi:hypothetical protein